MKRSWTAVAVMLFVWISLALTACTGSEVSGIDGDADTDGDVGEQTECSQGGATCIGNDAYDCGPDNKWRLAQSCSVLGDYVCLYGTCQKRHQSDGDVDGDADTDGDIDGDVIEGDADADGDVDGDVIEGDADADGDVDGDVIEGDADADGDVDGDVIEGDADTDGDVDGDVIDGDADADDDTDTDGDADGDVIDGDADADDDSAVDGDVVDGDADEEIDGDVDDIPDGDEPDGDETDGDVDEEIDGDTVDGDETDGDVDPNALLINEIKYDQDDVDGSQIFVELKGPAGASLDNCALIGIDSLANSQYASIDLSGHNIPADGYFVITHQDATGIYAANSDMSDNSVDFQNGPDSVILSCNGSNVDILGYGDSATRYEGSPAADVYGNNSLARIPDGSDTADNSVDFTDCPSPTPGAANRCEATIDLTIYDVQNPSAADHPNAGSRVQLNGVVVTSTPFVVASGSGLTGVFVSDIGGGPWTGCLVTWKPTSADAEDGYDPPALSRGKVINVEGVYAEYCGIGDSYTNCSTQIEVTPYGGTNGTITNTGVMAGVPAAQLVLAANVASGGADSEKWQHSLVEIEDATVTKNDGGYSEFIVEDSLIVDDLLYAYAIPAVDEVFTTLRGFLYTAYDDFKLLPRDAEDMVVEPVDGDEDGDSDDPTECTLNSQCNSGYSCHNDLGVCMLWNCSTNLDCINDVEFGSEYSCNPNDYLCYRIDCGGDPGLCLGGTSCHPETELCTSWQCDSDADCTGSPDFGQYYHCSTDKLCILGSCNNDGDCPTGTSCHDEQGLCMPLECDTDNDCANRYDASFACDLADHLCYRASCANDHLCPMGSVCHAFDETCLVPECESDAQCGGDTYCHTDGLCYFELCMTQAGCLGDRTCAGNLCRPNCTSTADCPDELLCHLQRGYCLEFRCNSDLDCNEPESYCSDEGLCYDPSCAAVDDICPDNMVCDVENFLCRDIECETDAECELLNDFTYECKEPGLCQHIVCQESSDCPVDSYCTGGQCHPTPNCAQAAASVEISGNPHVIKEGVSVQLSAAVYDVNGVRIDAIASGCSFYWSNNCQFVSVSSNGLVTGTNAPGICSLEVRVVEAPEVSDSFSITNYRENTQGVRVVVFDEQTGELPNGVRVVLNGTEQVTDDGFTQFPLETCDEHSPCELHVFDDDYSYFSAFGVETSDILVPLVPNVDLSVAAGVKGHVNFEAIPEALVKNMRQAVTALPFDANPADWRWETLFGEKINTHVQIGAMFDDWMLVPSGIEQYTNTDTLKDGYQATGRPQKGALWSYGGYFELVDMIEIVTGLLEDDYDFRMFIQAMAPLREDFHHGVLPGVTPVSHPRVQDTEDINDNDDTTDFVPDYDKYTEMTNLPNLTQAASYETDVALSRLPDLSASTCAEGVFSMVMAMQPDGRNVPLGWGWDFDVVSTEAPDCLVGYDEPAVVSYAPVHSGVSAEMYRTLSVAVSVTDNDFDPLGDLNFFMLTDQFPWWLMDSVSHSAVFHQALASPQNPNMPDFLNAPYDASFDAVSRTMTATPVAHADFHRVIFTVDDATSQESRSWVVYWPSDANGFTLPQISGVQLRYVNPTRSKVQAIEVYNDYVDLLEFNNYNLHQMEQIMRGYSTTPLEVSE